MHSHRIPHTSSPMSDAARFRVVTFFLLLTLPVLARDRAPHRVSAIFSSNPPIPSLSYRNAGYQLVSNKAGTITVTIDSSPLRIAARYPTPILDSEAIDVLKRGKRIPLPNSIRGKGRELAANARGYVQAADRVLCWLHSHFSYRKTEAGPLRGDCNTAARTAVALLAEAGIPAREIDGMVIETGTRVLSGAALHRWIEVYYPGFGWLFSDPLSSLHYVPPSYIVLDHVSRRDLLGTTLTCIKPYRPAKAIGILKHSSMTERINLYRFP